LPIYRQIDPTTLIVEQATEHLAMLGVEKGLARTVLDQVVRLFKELMYRAGLALGRAFGVQPGDAVVKAYVENAWLRFINRDFASANPREFFRTVIGGAPTVQERVAFYSSPKGQPTSVTEVDLMTGQQFLPEFVAKDVQSMADRVDQILRSADIQAERDVDLTVRVPPTQPAMLVPELQLKGEVAYLNQIETTLTNIFQDQDVRRATPNIDMAKFFKDWLGLSPDRQPAAIRTALMQRAASAGVQQVAPTTRINDLPGGPDGSLGSLQADAIIRS